MRINSFQFNIEEKKMPNFFYVRALCYHSNLLYRMLKRLNSIDLKANRIINLMKHILKMGLMSL